MKRLRAELERAGQAWGADRREDEMRAVPVWIFLKEGALDQAVRFMRAAADGEDGSLKHIAMENRLYPLRELLADLLLEVGQPAAALKEYATPLTQPPNPYPADEGAAAAATSA